MSLQSRRFVPRHRRPFSSRLHWKMAQHGEIPTQRNGFNGSIFYRTEWMAGWWRFSPARQSTRSLSVGCLCDEEDQSEATRRCLSRLISAAEEENEKGIFVFVLLETETRPINTQRHTHTKTNTHSCLCVSYKRWQLINGRPRLCGK